MGRGGCGVPPPSLSHDKCVYDECCEGMKRVTRGYQTSNTTHTTSINQQQQPLWCKYEIILKSNGYFEDRVELFVQFLQLIYSHEGNIKCTSVDYFCYFFTPTFSIFLPLFHKKCNVCL